jgi:hypothetical protein
MKVWVVESRKTSEGGWIFRKFDRKIMPDPLPNAIAGKRYKVELKLVDPQLGSKLFYIALKGRVFIIFGFKLLTEHSHVMICHRG